MRGACTVAQLFTVSHALSVQRQLPRRRYAAQVIDGVVLLSCSPATAHSCTRAVLLVWCMAKLFGRLIDDQTTTNDSGRLQECCKTAHFLSQQQM